MKTNILDFDLGQWQTYIKEIGFESYRAKQIFQWLHQKRVQNLETMGNVSKMIKEHLQNDFYFGNCKVNKQLVSNVDETRKILFTLGNPSENSLEKQTDEHPDKQKGRQCETVWIPSENSGTICVSTQSGCSLDCSFCATGKMPFKGNLTSGEILTQIYELLHLIKKPVTNIVFMGMGEPFMNYAETIKAARILSDDHSLNISSKKITISTCGVLPGIKEFVENKEPFNLAISVHTFNHSVRLKMMSAEKKWPIQGIFDYLKKNKKLYEKHKIMLEYVLLFGVNMSDADADNLGVWAKAIGAKVNLISVNQAPLVQTQGARSQESQTQGNHTEVIKFKTNSKQNRYQAPEQLEIDKFWKKIKSHGVEVFKRSSRGADILAACGMLAGE